MVDSTCLGGGRARVRFNVYICVCLNEMGFFSLFSLSLCGKIFMPTPRYLPSFSLLFYVVNGNCTNKVLQYGELENALGRYKDERHKREVMRCISPPHHQTSPRILTTTDTPTHSSSFFLVPQHTLITKRHAIYSDPRQGAKRK